MDQAIFLTYPGTVFCGECGWAAYQDNEPGWRATCAGESEGNFLRMYCPHQGCANYQRRFLLPATQRTVTFQP